MKENLHPNYDSQFRLGKAESKPPPRSLAYLGAFCLLPVSELELELIQTQMTQKPMLRAEVYARALRASQNRKEDSV